MVHWMKLLRTAACLILGFGFFLTVENSVFADPTREEVFRNDNLKIVVYKDGADPNTFWYLPPLKWLENNGQLVYYKRPRGDRMDYYFYVVPYMTPEMLRYLASEIPAVRTEAQLKPLQLKRLGIRIQQFDVGVIGPEATDYQYLNTPQLLRMSLDPVKTEEFEFFMANPPGVLSHIFFFYSAERVTRYLNLELSCKDVYTAVRVGLAGKYEFIRAEIEDRVFEYMANRYLHIRSKGDIPLPEIVNRSILECFTPIRPTIYTSALPERSSSRENLKRLQDWFDAYVTESPEYDPSENLDSFLPFPADIPKFAYDSGRSFLNPDLPPPMPGGGPFRPMPGSPGQPVVGPTVPGIGVPITPPGTGPILPPVNPPRPPIPGPGPMPPGGNMPGQDGIYFAFRNEMMSSERKFFLHQEQVTDSEEITAVPLMLTFSPSAPPSNVEAEPIPQRDFVVEHTNDQRSPLRSGLQVARGEQYTLNANFAVFIDSRYVEGRQRLRWGTEWGNPNNDLYYRIGTGPWVSVGTRAIISSDNLQTGELQFSLDRSKIWENIPDDVKRPSRFMPQALQYNKTFPQFNVVVTGRRVRVR